MYVCMYGWQASGMSCRTAVDNSMSKDVLHKANLFQQFIWEQQITWDCWPLKYRRSNSDYFRVIWHLWWYVIFFVCVFSVVPKRKQHEFTLVRGQYLPSLSVGLGEASSLSSSFPCSLQVPASNCCSMVGHNSRKPFPSNCDCSLTL